MRMPRLALIASVLSVLAIATQAQAAERPMALTATGCHLLTNLTPDSTRPFFLASRGGHGEMRNP